LGDKKIKLNINLEELVDAYEDSSLINIYYIDTKKNELIYYNDALGEPVEVRKKLDSYSDNDRYLYIPPRLSQDEFFIMKSFVYTIKDFNVAEKFHNALERKKPFKNFKSLMYEYPNLSKKWFEYKYNTIKNETIDWLCENNIELENQQLIPEIEIKEMTRDEIKNLPEELKGFGPFACLKCHNKEGLKAQWFMINVTPENRLIEKETQKILKEKFNINHYGNFSGEKQELLTAAKCPKCGSEEIFWDY
jgi:hypothetical protein